MKKITGLLLSVMVVVLFAPQTSTASDYDSCLASELSNFAMELFNGDQFDKIPQEYKSQLDVYMNSTLSQKEETKCGGSSYTCDAGTVRKECPSGKVACDARSKKDFLINEYHHAAAAKKCAGKSKENKPAAANNAAVPSNTSNKSGAAAKHDQGLSDAMNANMAPKQGTLSKEPCSLAGQVRMSNGTCTCPDGQEYSMSQAMCVKKGSAGTASTQVTSNDKKNQYTQKYNALKKKSEENFKTWEESLKKGDKTIGNFEVAVKLIIDNCWSEMTGFRTSELIDLKTSQDDGRKLCGALETKRDNAISKANNATDKANARTITYDLDGGKLSGKGGKIKRDCKDGETFTLESAPEKKDNEFLGWKYANGQVVEAGASGVSCGNHTITAQWKNQKAEDKANTRTITYMLDGGKLDSKGGITGKVTDTCKDGETFTLESAPEKKGHTFKGWKYANDQVVEAGYSGVSCGNHTITAQWEKGAGDQDASDEKESAAEKKFKVAFEKLTEKFHKKIAALKK